MGIINIIRNSPFKPLTKEYYLGKLTHGTPYFYARGFCESIIKIRKLKLTPLDILKKKNKDFPHLKKVNMFINLPMVRRSKNWTVKMFDNFYYIEIGSPIKYHISRLGWKDKFNSPRFEWNPAFFIFFFKWQFCIWWKAPTSNDDLYWEMFLWWKYYSNKDIVKAEETWGWLDFKTKISTWDKNNLK